jgi:uncharacterized protein (TIGR02453 family)
MAAKAKAKAAKPTAAIAPFTGFAKDAMGFWHELASEMNKAWFDDHKPRYQELWVAPMTSLLAAVGAGVAATYRGSKIGAPHVMRIYRDVRFAKDKTPYKTHIAGAISLDGKKPTTSTTVLYAHFGLIDEYLGAGKYTLEPDQLVRWRKAVAHPKTGAALAKLVADLRARGFSIEAGETSVRVPKPFAADHPRAELLKMKGLIVGFPDVPKGLIHKPAFVPWLVAQSQAVAPVVKWLHANV